MQCYLDRKGHFYHDGMFTVNRSDVLMKKCRLGIDRKNYNMLMFNGNYNIGSDIECLS